MHTVIPSYRELYSISDLHLGGEAPDSQIFCQGARVRAFLDRLSRKPESLALVIAGDLFDSLPYLTGTGSYIAVDGATALVRTVMQNPSFAPVFQGLRTFLEAKGRELILLIGNHDLEIALPEAQEALLEVIAPNSDARGRVRFSTSGCGFRCQVGRATVFVSHGNEADPWNHVDHEALRRAAHSRALGQPFDSREWVPNAGTRLVVDVMNAIKAAHPFIDILKPETPAAVKVLVALAPKTVARLLDALPALAQAAIAHAGPHTVLGDGRAVPSRESESFRLLREATMDAVLQSDDSGKALLARVNELDDHRTPASALVSDDDATLNIVTDRLFRRQPSLRTALEGWLRDDRSYDLGYRDSTCEGILSQVGCGIDVVIAGHTHLPRWISALERNIVYLNAGAWCRVMGLRPSYFESEVAFAPVDRALRAADLKVLDETRVQAFDGEWPLVLDATAAAHVVAHGDTTVSELVRVTERDGAVTEEAIDRTKAVLEWP